MGRFAVFILFLLALIFWSAVPEDALRAETPQQKSERIRCGAKRGSACSSTGDP